MDTTKSPPLFTAFKYLTLLLALFVVFFPIYSVFVGAFKTQAEFYQSSALAFPADFFHFDNFKRVYEVGDLGLGFRNTLVILVCAVAGNVVLGTMVAYALGRFDFKLKTPIMGMYLVAQVIPMVTTQVATFSIIQNLGLYNTMGAPILLYLGADVLQIVIYLQFVNSIPKDLDESAMIEGRRCSASTARSSSRCSALRRRRSSSSRRSRSTTTSTRRTCTCRRRSSRSSRPRSIRSSDRTRRSSTSSRRASSSSSSRPSCCSCSCKNTSSPASRTAR